MATVLISVQKRLGSGPVYKTEGCLLQAVCLVRRARFDFDLGENLAEAGDWVHAGLHLRLLLSLVLVLLVQPDVGLRALLVLVLNADVVDHRV